MAKDVLSDADLKRIWCACKSIDNAAFAREFSDAILAAAEPAIRAEERTRVMRAYAMRHDYLGLCPDDMQPNSYDPKCKACRAIRQLGAGSKGDTDVHVR